MAKKPANPSMKSEMWFGGRKNKRCIEIDYKQDQQEQFVNDLVNFLSERGFKVRKLYPERPADYTDPQGRQYWMKEGLIGMPGRGEQEIREFFIRSDEKKLNGKKPHIRTKRINGRRRTIQSESLTSDDMQNQKIIDEIMNQMLLTDMLGDDE